MKKLTRNFLLLGLSFGVVVYFIPGFKSDNYQTLIIACFLFAFLSLLVKPFLVTLLTPLSFLTFGLVKPLTNLLLIFSLTVLIPSFKIQGWQFAGFSFANFSLPPYWVNTLLTLVLASLASSFIYSWLEWFFD